MPPLPPHPAPLMSKNKIKRFMSALALAYPDAQSELDYRDSFSLLVSVVLSAQATDKSVNRVTPGLFAAAPTPEAMVQLGEEGIAAYIRSIGLWRTKARNVHKLAQQLLENHQGNVPPTRSALESLAGVGRKTANVVLNIAFGEDAMAVDTHIFRIGNRTGLAPGKSPRAVEEALRARLPPSMLRPAHHWLILHGRYTCSARSPKCRICTAFEACNSPDKSRQMQRDP